LRITLVGFGKSNKALLKALHGDYEFFLSEMRKLSEEERLFLEGLKIPYEESHTRRLLRSDLIILSPGVSPYSKAGKMVLESGKPYDVDVGFFFRVNQKHSIVIGVTGTNGKSTVTSLICHVLREFGRSCFLGGNNENPLFTLKESVDYIVLELSSFQLFWARSIPLDVGVFLNFAPDHLDWHSSLEHYFSSKARIADMSSTFICAEKLGPHFDRPITFSSDDVDINKLPVFLQTSQNISNVAAAIKTLMELGFSEVDVYKAVQTFKPLPHRMEVVGEKDGVLFIDDSKATNTHSVLKALSNFERVTLILSGIIKEEDLEDFKKVVREKADVVILLGKEVRKKIDLRGNEVFLADDMDEAVKIAYERTRCKKVLLSPAGASFDMYRNYAERGDDFKRAVEKLMRDG